MAEKLMGERFLERLVETNPPPADLILDFAFRDFVADSISGAKRYPDNHSTGITEKAVALALMNSADDLDDVDWDVLTHPGSIIWPALIAAHVEDKGNISDLFAAANAGYMAGRSISKLMGPSHRGTWHLTATAGSFAATFALARYWHLSHEEQIAALKMVLTNMSGSPQAGFERQGATQFNRAVAVSLAVTSVTAAQMHSPYIHEIWDGPRGVVSLYNLSPQILEAAVESDIDSLITEGCSSIHIRTYFATGFASSAIAATLKLLNEHGIPDKVEFEMTKGLANIFDGTRGGLWWSPLLIIKSLLESRDPFNLSAENLWKGSVTMTLGDVVAGGAKITFEIGDEVISENIQTPPFKISELNEDEITLIHRKWEILSGTKDLPSLSPIELIQKVKALI